MKLRDLTSFSFIDNKPRYSVKFFLMERKGLKKEKTELPLYCRIILQRQKTEFSLNLLVSPQDWDHSLGKFNTYKKHLNYLNVKLGEVEGRIDEIYSALVKEKAKISPLLIRQRFQGKVVDMTKVKLTAFLEIFINEISRRTQEYTKPTVNHYRALQTHLHRFLELNNQLDMELTEVNRNFLDRFENYLLTTPHSILGKAMNKNTCNRYLTKLKVVIKNAIRKELMNKNPFDGFKISREKGNKTFLTKEELKLINDSDLGGNESLKRVRDIFMFSVYSGLRFSDAANLKDSSVEKDENGELWIYGYQIKTKDRIDIPMLNKAKEIYDRYEESRKRTGYVLPRMSSQKVNMNLKEIARFVGIRKRITFHVSRHTFATQALENGIPIHLVSQFLGHASLKTTEIYTHVTRKHLSEVSSKLNKAIS